MDDEPVTCREFHSRVTSAVRQLKSASIKPGDRVLLTLSPSVDMIAIVVAILAVGMQGEQGTLIPTGM